MDGLVEVSPKVAKRAYEILQARLPLLSEEEVFDICAEMQEVARGLSYDKRGRLRFNLTDAQAVMLAALAKLQTDNRR